jgi:hypothetical protein
MPDIVATAAPTICTKCAAPLAAQARFCEACGAAVPGVARPARRRGRLATGRITVDAHRGQIRTARVTIGFVALVSLAFIIYTHVQFLDALAVLRAKPGVVIDEQVVASRTMFIYAGYLIAAVFTGLIFWAKANPFAACLTALILYLSTIVAGALMDPRSLTQAWVIRMVIIALLINGVKSGLAWRRLVAKGEVA